LSPIPSKPGLEPGDEEDIIVAAESPVEDIEEAEATDAEKADTEKADTEKADTEATDAESDPEATAVRRRRRQRRRPWEKTTSMATISKQ